MIKTFNDLKKHVGHKIACVRQVYGGEKTNVALECEDCHVVLVSLNGGDIISIEDTDSRICPGWHISDIISQARENDINLSDQQAREILHRIADRMDASVGINWDVIDVHTDQYLDDISGG